MKGLTCWVLYSVSNEPDSYPKSVSAWAEESMAEIERERLNAMAEPLRAEAQALYEAKEAHEVKTGYGFPWYEVPDLRDMSDAYVESVRAFEDSENVWFEPSSYRPRDDSWQPTFELKELPWNPLPATGAAHE